MISEQYIPQKDAIIVFVSILLFISIHLAFEYQQDAAICHVEHSYPYVIELFLFAEIFVFYFNTILQLTRLIYIHIEEQQIKPILANVYFITASISALAGTSALNLFIWNYGG